jgi:hypothetical protein
MAVIKLTGIVLTDGECLEYDTNVCFTRSPNLARISLLLLIKP